MVDLALLLRSRSAQKQVAHDLRQPPVKRGMRPTQHFRLHAQFCPPIACMLQYSTLSITAVLRAPAGSTETRSRCLARSGSMWKFLRAAVRQQTTARPALASASHNPPYLLTSLTGKPIPLHTSLNRGNARHRDAARNEKLPRTFVRSSNQAAVWVWEPVPYLTILCQQAAAATTTTTTTGFNFTPRTCDLPVAFSELVPASPLALARGAKQATANQNEAPFSFSLPGPFTGLGCPQSYHTSGAFRLAGYRAQSVCGPPQTRRSRPR